MPGISVPLNQASISVTPVGGAVTLVIQPGPRLGRIWQGTFIIPGAPSAAVWTIQLGGFSIANLSGPGPFGPLQVQSGVTVKLIGSSGAGSSPLTAYILGIDDPVDNASLFTGPAALPSPAAPANVTIVSPTFQQDANGIFMPAYADTNVNVANVANGGQVLAAPAAGKAYYFFNVWADAAASDTAILNGPEIATFISAVNQYNPSHMNGIVKYAGAVTYGAVNVNQAASFLINYWLGPA